MGWVFIIVAAILAGVIKNYLSHKKDMELERMKQENYLLENEEMRTVLDRIKKDNKRLEAENNSKWLIQETRERQLERRD